MRGIDGEGRQHRIDLLAEELSHPRALSGVEVVGLDEGDSFGSQRWPEFVLEQRRGVPELLGCCRPDSLELGRRCQAVGSGPPHTRLNRVEHGGNPHLEELVEVRCVDRDELDALEKRQITITCECQDAMIEVEPGQLSIEVALG